MTDYIKREDALDIVADNNVTGEITLNRYDKIIGGIYDIPSADVAPVRHGRWIEGKLPIYRWGGEKIGEKSTWKCSVCHDVGFWGYNYCPNCGAKMDEEAK